MGFLPPLFETKKFPSSSDQTEATTHTPYSQRLSKGHRNYVFSLTFSPNKTKKKSKKQWSDDGSRSHELGGRPKLLGAKVFARLYQVFYFVIF